MIAGLQHEVNMPADFCENNTPCSGCLWPRSDAEIIQSLHTAHILLFVNFANSQPTQTLTVQLPHKGEQDNLVSARRAELQVPNINPPLALAPQRS